MSGEGREAELAAARLLLDRMGISPADLTDLPRARAEVPAVAAYVATVAAAVGEGTRRVYGSYWDRVVATWGDRRLDEVSASDIRALLEHTKANVVVRRTNRGGASAGEHLVAALRCLYRHAEDDGLITRESNPAQKVA